MKLDRVLFLLKEEQKSIEESANRLNTLDSEAAKKVALHHYGQATGIKYAINLLEKCEGR